MRIILLKSQIFKMVCGGPHPKRRVRVPGLVDFQPCTDADWGETISKKFNGQLKDKRKILGLSMDHDFTLCVSVNASDDAKIELETSQQTLHGIREMLKDDNVQFQAMVCLIGFLRNGEVDTRPKGLSLDITSSLYTKEMTMEQKDDYFVCADNSVRVPLPLLPIMNGNCGSFNATVMVSMTTSNISLDPVSNQETQMLINKTILTDEVASDAVIIPGSGRPVKCHRSFLIANSPVFAAMFQNGMEGAKSGEIRMPDKSEQVVRAFLAYLYFRDLSAPNAKLEVSFELLAAGNKFQIPDLENIMTNLIKYKPLQWFDDVDVVTKLYLFARISTDGDELKKKAIVVLKMKHGELHTSATFRDLFQTSSVIAMELCQDLAGAEIWYCENNNSNVRIFVERKRNRC